MHEISTAVAIICWDDQAVSVCQFHRPACAPRARAESVAVVCIEGYPGGSDIAGGESAVADLLPGGWSEQGD